MGRHQTFSVLLSPRFLGTGIITAVISSLVAAISFMIFWATNEPVHVPGEVIQATGQQFGVYSFLIAALGAIVGLLIAPLILLSGLPSVVSSALLGRSRSGGQV